MAIAIGTGIFVWKDQVGRVTPKQAWEISEPQYLIFQLFTFSPTPEGKAQPFKRSDITKAIDEILEKVENLRGDGKAR